MNNILKQAKELKKKFDFFISVEKNCIVYLKGKKISGKDKSIHIKMLRKEATKLLKIARLGCGVIFKAQIYGNKICGNLKFCPDCQEAIKILEGILK